MTGTENEEQDAHWTPKHGAGRTHYTGQGQRGQDK